LVVLDRHCLSTLSLACRGSRISALSSTPVFVKLVRIISRLIQALRSIGRRRAIPSPPSDHLSIHVHILPRPPSPIRISVPEYLDLPSEIIFRTPSPSPFGPRTPPDSPLSSSSTLEGYEPSEGSTVARNDFEEPPPRRPDTLPSEGDFEGLENDFHEEEGDLQLAETHETWLEYQEIEGIRSRILTDRVAYLQLVETFGEFGIVPGTGDWTVRDFFPVYLLAAQRSTSPIHIPPSLYSERDLLGDQSSTSEESYGAPEEQDFTISTIPLVHPSAGHTPAPSNTSSDAQGSSATSLNSGEVYQTAQESTSGSAASSSEEV
jgi:hypothetical protein